MSAKKQIRHVVSSLERWIVLEWERKERRRKGVSVECDTDGEREMERHLYCRQGHSDGRKSKASESIRPLSGVLVSRLPVALRIFATQRQPGDYTHMRSILRPLRAGRGCLQSVFTTCSHTNVLVLWRQFVSLAAIWLLKWRAHQAGLAGWVPLPPVWWECWQ